MPKLIEYDLVRHTLEGQQLRSLYPQSGAFGFVAGTPVFHRGWIGPSDPTIRPQAMALVRQAALPCEAVLARAAVSIWTGHWAAPLWLMPKSHWAYELKFGNASWLAPSLESIGISADELGARADGAAVSFERPEAPIAAEFLQILLTHLAGSDFQMVWPGIAAICGVHHHKQLWWTVIGAGLAADLDRLPLV